MGTLPFDLEIEDIAALADIINEKDLGEIRLEDEDIGAKIVIKGRPLPPPPPPVQPIYGTPMAAPAPEAAPAKAETNPTEQAPEGETVKAPIVGTYYSSPAPDKPPFVQVGQKVKRGDIVMIIESMKIMNEIPCPVDGTVKKLLVKNGEAVEFDQPIMIIG
ncbi:MAG: acetyl-CoA carboxylase biotin carboxyl carrier protein [Oscillospiraceae bacterium]|nr:acetyl-CoA carboxylase biotin carboxyl carrier protein [Oscillospiraceae bacterium]